MIKSDVISSKSKSVIAYPYLIQYACAGIVILLVNDRHSGVCLSSNNDEFEVGRLHTIGENIHKHRILSPNEQIILSNKTEE